MIKVRFFINTLGGGGAEKVLVDLLNLLDSKRYELSLVTLTGGTHETELGPHIRYKKIIGTKNKVLKRILQSLLFHIPRRLFCVVFMRGKYDIEVAYLEGFPTDVVCALKTKATKISFVHCDVSVHSIMDSLYSSREECLSTYKKFDRTCFVSRQAMMGFEKSVGPLSHALVIHNVLNTEQIIRLSNESCPDYQTAGLKLVTVGRLTAPKNFQRLLNVAAELEKTFSFELWIIGEGEMRSDLETVIAEKKIRSVRLLGFHSNPYPYMKKADLFVCSSDYEGYSTAVTESVLLGVPVLTTDCAGMDEILEDGKYGMIVDRSDEALLAGLQSLMRNSTQLNRYKRAVLEKSEMLIKSKNIAEYEELFQSMKTYQE